MKSHIKFNKINALALAFYLFAFGYTVTAIGQYQYTNIGPRSSENIGSQNDLPTSYSSHVFLGNNYHSRNGGDTFEPLANHISLNGTISIASGIFADRYDNDVIYMGINTENPPSPFARSLNGGGSWEYISEPFGEEKYSVLLCQDTAGTLFLLTTNFNSSSFSLFKSFDKGSAWGKIEINKGKKKIESSNLYYLWADPVKAGMLYAVWISGTLNGYEAAFLVSKDSGENWERREKGLEHNARGNIKYKYLPHCVTQSPTEPYRIYLINGNGYIDGHNAMAYSNDRGKNWTTLEMNKDGSQFWAVKVNPTNKNMIYAIGASAQNQTSEWGYTFYKSKDGGKSWRRKATIINPPEGYWPEVTGAWRLFVTPTGRIIVHDYVNGVLISDDEGETFTIHNSNIKSPTVQLFKTSKGEIIAGSAWYAFYSKDNAATWSRSLFGPAFSIKETDGGTIFGKRYYSSNFLICVNGDLSSCHYLPWINMPASNLALEWIENDHRIICGPSYYPLDPGSDPSCYFHKSDDYGGNWEKLGFITGKDKSKYLSVSAIISTPTNTNILVAGGYYALSRPLIYGNLWDASQGAIYLSEDQGYTWQEVFGQDQIGSVISLRRDECIPGVLIASASGFNEKGGVFVSEDFGRTWERRSNGLSGYESNGTKLLSCVVSPVRDGTLYCAVNLNGGIYKSDNWGISWTRISTNPVPFSEEFIDDFVCLGEGVNIDNPVTLSTLCMTDILPLDDGKESLLISTLADGLFLLEKQE